MLEGHSEIKFDIELEITEDQYAKYLLGLNQQENFIIALGTALVENYIQQAYNSNQLTVEKRDAFKKDIKGLRDKLAKGIEHMKNERKSKGIL